MHQDSETDTTALEREMGSLVYTLYGPTPEEIKIVEGASNVKPTKVKAAAA